MTSGLDITGQEIMSFFLKLAPKYGYELIVVDKLKDNGRDISSTYIREEVARGK